MENLISSKPTEHLKVKHTVNPFIFEAPLRNQAGQALDMPNIRLLLLRDLSRNALFVFTLIPYRYFNDGSSRLEVKELCIILFDEPYNEANATRVRRGIRELVTKKIIAYSDTKDIYWINKGIIWVN